MPGCEAGPSAKKKRTFVQWRLLGEWRIRNRNSSSMLRYRTRAGLSHAIGVCKMNVKGPPEKERRDARANRSRILTAACAVFASQGLEADIKDIAASAGVGMGTIYRDYGSKK